MAHVGLQDRQQRGDVLAAGEPRPKIVDCHGVSQIVDAGAVAPAAVGDAGLPEKPAEVLVDVADRQRAPGGAGEEPVPAGAPGDAGVVVGQSVAQPGADRDLPVFAALAVADCQDPGVEVDVVEAQQPGFGGTQPFSGVS